MVLPFPAPGLEVRLAYRELRLAVGGPAAARERLGDPADLPKPWDPPTCTAPGLRLELWRWLDDVVGWLNQEYTWDVSDLIPNCWPQHPHLVHEIAVIADQRHRAGQTPTSELLEEWHRYSLPMFTNRLRARSRTGCSTGHTPWPGRATSRDQHDPDARMLRENRFAADLDAAAAPTDDPWLLLDTEVRVLTP